MVGALKNALGCLLAPGRTTDWNLPSFSGVFQTDHFLRFQQPSYRMTLHQHLFSLAQPSQSRQAGRRPLGGHSVRAFTSVQYAKKAALYEHGKYSTHPGSKLSRVTKPPHGLLCMTKTQGINIRRVHYQLSQTSKKHNENHPSMLMEACFMNGSLHQSAFAPLRSANCPVS